MDFKIVQNIENHSFIDKTKNNSKIILKATENKKNNILEIEEI